MCRGCRSAASAAACSVTSARNRSNCRCRAKAWACACSDLSWSAPRLRPGSGSLWLRVEFDELRATRVDLALSDAPSTDTDPPKSLQLPVGVTAKSLRIDEFHIDGLDTPLRQLAAHVELGADGGAQHKLDGLQLRWDRLRLVGRAQVATADGLAVDAALDLSQQPAGAGEWTAALRLAGPLATPQLQATLRAQASAVAPTADAGRQRHAAPLCRLAAGRAAGQRARARPVGAAQRRAAHRAGPGCVGTHAGAGPAGRTCSCR